VSGVSSTQPLDSRWAIVDSPIPGAPSLAIHTEEGVLSTIEFHRPCPATRQPDPAAAQAQALLTAYFRDAHSEIPHLQPPHGTPFQHRVWQALQRIPPGETRRYGELARELGSSARAVANACRANPLPILIPCHRAVAASGPGGYMGEVDGPALEIKRWLLHHEGHV
jgi:methylated-DNA-[protein]-cysteine S-methyltransferase